MSLPPNDQPKPTKLGWLSKDELRRLVDHPNKEHKMSDKKKQRKYHSIRTMEEGITAYIMINSLLDMYDGTENRHIAVAKFVAKSTLNELLNYYVEKNNEAQLQALIERLSAEASAEGSNDGPVQSTAVQSL